MGASVVRLLRSAIPAALVVFLLLLRPGGAQAPSTFASRIAALSEAGGYFDTDNLISNERSYLQVLPEIRQAGIKGGAYIGVGPDTNFTYIAATRPDIAFIIDIRRDNLLLHLLFKALFEISGSRIEYLAHLLGRPLPPAVDGWRAASLDRVVAYLERPALDPEGLAALRRRLDDAIGRTGVALTAEDLATIGRFHQRFIGEGLALRFNSIGRPPQYYYPTYRDLLLETDPTGRQASYLTSEESFQFVRSLHARHLIIPVVGDLGGPSALASIGKLLGSRSARLSVFYTSNVEFYLFGQGTFARFIANLQLVPRTKNSVIIRSVFGRYASGSRRDGSNSHLHAIEDLLTGTARGRFRSYGELVRR